MEKTWREMLPWIPFLVHSCAVILFCFLSLFWLFFLSLHTFVLAFLETSGFIPLQEFQGKACDSMLFLHCGGTFLWESGSKFQRTIVEGSLEVKLPTTWTDEKQRWSRRTEKRRAEERRSKKRKSQKKEDLGARKGRKVAKHCVLPMICGSRGSKSRLAKAAGAEPAGQMRDEKLHAVVARSTFRSQSAQNTPCPDHFWQLRCRKSARRCGAKHICKWKK